MPGLGSSLTSHCRNVRLLIQNYMTHPQCKSPVLYHFVDRGDDQQVKCIGSRPVPQCRGAGTKCGATSFGSSIRLRQPDHSRYATPGKQAKLHSCQHGHRTLLGFGHLRDTFATMQSQDLNTDGIRLNSNRGVVLDAAPYWGGVGPSLRRHKSPQSLWALSLVLTQRRTMNRFEGVVVYGRRSGCRRNVPMHSNPTQVMEDLTYLRFPEITLTYSLVCTAWTLAEISCRLCNRPASWT